MRRASHWTTLRYQLRRIGGRIACWWAWVVAGFEELAILVGVIPRYSPPRRRTGETKKP